MSIEVVAPPTGDAGRIVRSGQRFGVRLNQIIVTQAAVVAVLIGAIQGGSALVVAVISAVGLLALTWVRVRGRWAFGWLSTMLRFIARTRSARIDGPAAVLRFAAPRTLMTTADLAGTPAAVLADDFGLTLLLEIGDPSGEAPPLPSLATLLPATDQDQPPTQIQLVLTGVPAPPGRPGTGPAESSYRALCEGSSLGHHSAVLAVRVLRTGGWTEEELRRGLLGLGRRLTRRLASLPVRPLDHATAMRAIAELAHAGNPGDAREAWSGLRLGGLTQATFRCRPRPGEALPGHLVARLLHLPAAATTVAVTSELPSGRVTSLLVRLAATDATALSTTVQALHRLLAAEGFRMRRWDGAHLPGLTATLPLGGWAESGDSFDGSDLPAVPAGLMVGRNRQGRSVQARLFRPAPTLVLLVGGLPGAQLLAFRAIAAGARVLVRSTRPQAWEPFVRGAAAPGKSITVMPPNRLLDIPAGSPLRPTLTIVDTGRAETAHPVFDEPPSAGSSVSGEPPSDVSGDPLSAASGDPLFAASGDPLSAASGDPLSAADRWQTTLVVRDALGTGDLDLATRADLLVLQVLDPAEAALLGEALHLGATTTYLTRMRPDMIALVNRRTVRWATLAQTQIEAALVGEARRPLIRI
ncbi:type VII secretion protein EccE [Actinoplanes aureus]|uniref:Type VII secretion protein EccE n=1 Tax=Actinoplanes aureus TaxID=2792083 RepID=A0A931FZY3_9ACTN|nr:type VII secretion protein EccE [Actinoplanes aureus]MBG0565260.1 type VII secretion protein EccE [Actinoplanes aureus]